MDKALFICETWNLLCKLLLIWINPFHANVPFLHPLKTSENQRFYDVFMGYRNGILAGKGLAHFVLLVSFYKPWKQKTNIFCLFLSMPSYQKYMRLSMKTVQSSFCVKSLEYLEHLEYLFLFNIACHPHSETYPEPCQASKMEPVKQSILNVWKGSKYSYDNGSTLFFVK